MVVEGHGGGHLAGSVTHDGSRRSSRRGLGETRQCSECAKRPALPTSYFCQACINSFIACIRRRQAAAARLPVLEDAS